MMYSFYCDESNHLPNDSKPIMGIGYCKCLTSEAREHNKAIRSIIVRHRKKGELKWTNISDSNLEMYEDIVNYFLNTVNLWFRIVLIDKSEILKEVDFDEFYYKMVYQLMKFNESNDPIKVFIDKKDTLGFKRQKTLHQILLNKGLNVTTLQQVASNEVALIQLADVLIGAIVRQNINPEAITSGAKSRIIDLLKSTSGNKLNETSLKSSSKINVFKIKLSS